MARRRQRAKQSFVYVEVPNRRRSIWYMNPPKPVEVWKCSWHGKYRRYGHNPPGCRKCQEASDRRSADLRSPPRPAYEGVAGCCSLCGRSPLPGRRRSWCSDECVLMWQLATDTNVVKQHFHGLGLRCCWSCGRTGQRFQVDHVRPLWSLSPEDRLELRWWLPFNLQLLCQPCHREKSAWESRLRPAVQQGKAEWSPWPGLETSGESTITCD